VVLPQPARINERYFPKLAGALQFSSLIGLSFIPDTNPTIAGYSDVIDRLTQRLCPLIRHIVSLMVRNPYQVRWL
jgi:hypothetical protein